MGLSRLCEKCRKCPKANKCDHKQMESLAYLPEPYAAPHMQPATMSATAPITQPHEYRNVKIAENTTVTIDLEDIKEKMRNQFFTGLMQSASRR